MSKKNERRRRQTRAKKQKSPSLLIPIIVGAVVLAIVIGAIISIRGAQRATAGLGPSNTAQPLDTRSIPYPDVPRVSPPEAQQWLEQGQAVLVDVRDKALYDAAHAAGAISIPEAEMVARSNELPRDQEIILYCT